MLHFQQVPRVMLICLVQGPHADFYQIIHSTGCVWGGGGGVSQISWVFVFERQRAQAEQREQGGAEERETEY